MNNKSILPFIACLVASNSLFAQQSLFKSKTYTDSLFTKGIEGPAVAKDGRLYLVNFAKEGTIGVVDKGKATLFVELPEGHVGNGIRFGSKGEMYIADYTGHNVLKVDMKTRAVSVHAHEAKMNQPNDIAITSGNELFASDPNWKESTGRIWYIDTKGKVKLLEAGMSTTNGIEVSPGDKRLYVNESVSRKIWVYDLKPGGLISNKRLLIQFEDFGMDGMRCDVAGNLYVCRYDAGLVLKISLEGKVLQQIRLTGQKPTNIAFGGPDGKTAYVTLQDRGRVETFRVDKPGREWAMQQQLNKKKK